MRHSKLLVATKNAGKIKELTQLLANSGLEIISLSSFPSLADVEETGLTFTENALIKAHYYYKETQLLSLSDDSGLSVDVLDGRPGVYSARYGGPNASDKTRYEKLLAELKDIPLEKRTAHFTCSLALVGKDLEEVFSANTQGRIIFSPRGENGFGYDPIFEYLPLSKTFAELNSQEKASVSHRGKALAQLREYIINKL